MGYYNFYKIIKDIFITFFGKRNLRRIIILLLIIVILFVMRSHGSVFASSDIVYEPSNNINNVSFNLSAWKDYHFFITISTVSSGVHRGKYTALAFISSGDILVQNRKSSNGVYYDYFFTDSGKGNYMYGMYTSFSALQDAINSLTLNDMTSGSIVKVDSYYFTANNSISMDESTYYSNYDILNQSGNVVFESVKTFKNPEIANSLEDLQTLNFDVISVNAWDMSNEDFYVLFYNRSLSSSDDITTIYPIKEILLNGQQKYYQFGLTTNPDKNKIYWIPNDETGLFFKVGNTYEIRLAKRVSIDNPYSDWAYDYLGETVVFTISEDVSQQRIDNLNQASRDKTDKDRFDKQMEALNSQTQQDKEFYNTITSDNYDENTISDSIGDLSSSADDVSLESYTGLFSAIFNKFSTIIDGDYNSVDYISYPVMKTNQEIKIPSDLLSSKIKNTFIYTLLQSFWLFAFGIYIFKFSNNLVKKIKDGSILNGYENSNEVITSTML